MLGHCPVMRDDRDLDLVYQGHNAFSCAHPTHAVAGVPRRFGHGAEIPFAVGINYRLICGHRASYLFDECAPTGHPPQPLAAGTRAAPLSTAPGGTFARSDRNEDS
jgi:hypothetical protein